MDRKGSRKAINQQTMQAAGPAKIDALLSSKSSFRRGIALEEEGRRNLHSLRVLWLEKNQARAHQRGLSNKPQASSGHHEGIGAGWPSARAQHLKAPPRAHQISLSAERASYSETHAGMERRYNLYSFASGICLSDSHHRLVQPFRAGNPTFKQSRGHVLSRDTGGRSRAIWGSGNFQYRSRGAIHLSELCGGSFISRDPLQYGWQRPGLGQCVRRAAVEVIEI